MTESGQLRTPTRDASPRLAPDLSGPVLSLVRDGMYDDSLDQLLTRVGNRRVGVYERFVKGAIDRTAAAILLVVLSPLLLIVVLVVLASLGRPIYYVQARIGRDGRTFQMYKFRTMRPDRRRLSRMDWRGLERRDYHKSPDDPRHTPAGRLLRKSSLDELPQLLNILRGDMSFVGPRPEVPSIVAAYSGWQQLRHEVKPGLTGFWQTSARGGGRMHDFVHVDLEYVATMSWRTDLMCLLRTPNALVRHVGH